MATNRKVYGDVRDDLNILTDEFKALLAARGFKLTRNSGQYGTECKLTFTFEKATDDLSQTAAGKAFTSWQFSHRIPTEALGKVFTGGALKDTFIVGWNSNAAKNRILLKGTNGKEYACTVSAVHGAIAKGFLPDVTLIPNGAPVDGPRRADIEVPPPSTIPAIVR